MNHYRLKRFLLVGLLFLLPLLSWAQGPTTVTGSNEVCTVTGSNEGGTTLPNPLGNGVCSIFDFVVIVLNNIVLPIGSVIVVFMIIYTGFLFVTARGNESKLEDAKRNLLYVVIGAAILLGSVAIAAAIKGTINQIAPNLSL